MMARFLTVRETCISCGEALHHHRADDGPAWLTIIVVAHIVGPGMLWTYEAWQPDPLFMAAFFSLAAIALCLFLLPRTKGMMVGFQWAQRMHGFG